MLGKETCGLSKLSITLNLRFHLLLSKAESRRAEGERGSGKSGLACLPAAACNRTSSEASVQHGATGTSVVGRPRFQFARPPPVPCVSSPPQTPLTLLCTALIPFPIRRRTGSGRGSSRVSCLHINRRHRGGTGEEADPEARVLPGGEGRPGPGSGSTAPPCLRERVSRHVIRIVFDLHCDSTDQITS